MDLRVDNVFIDSKSCNITLKHLHNRCLTMYFAMHSQAVNTNCVGDRIHLTELHI